MNPVKLLAHFDRISEAPDAVPRLRRFILDLAVRGVLVTQNEDDEPASDLIELLKNDPQARTSSLPSQWMRARVGVLLEFRYGKALAEGDRLDRGPVSVFGSNGVIGYCAKPLTEESSIIIGRKGSAGALNFCSGPSWTTDVAYFVTPPAFFSIRFLLISLKTLDLNELGKGVKPGLSRLDAYDLQMMVPPLAEQHRIATKVDELMALCDRLEAAQAERENRRDRLTVASLHRLNKPAKADDGAVFTEHTRFHLSHLSRSTTRPGQIPALRQAILGLAVRGQLVPQDPYEESASELLARVAIQKTKAGNAKTGRDWVGDNATPVDEAFVAPRGWAWTRIGNGVERVTVGYVGPMKDQYVEGGIPFLRSQNVRPNRFREDGLISISPIFHQAIAKSALAPGDVVVVRSGNVGTACVIPPSLPVANCSDLVVVKNPAAVLPTFLCFYLNSIAAAHIVAGAVGVALTHFNTKSVATMPLPLPPIAEQHRIVAKVEELMAVCDQLEGQLASIQTESRLLLEAVLHEALVPAA